MLYTTQITAVLCIHMPILDKSWPVKNKAKLRLASDLKTCVNCIFLMNAKLVPVKVLRVIFINQTSHGSWHTKHFLV